MDPSLIKNFKNPPSEYRAKPFWAWNGTLKEETLRHQIRIMKSMGLGGFFMHSRIGLATPYLSQEWFHCINACRDEAEQLGMEAWLYDEDRWPSGAAGGFVTKNREYRARTLKATLYDKNNYPSSAQNVLARFAITFSGKTIKSFRRIPLSSPVKLAPGEKLLDFSIVIEEPSSWYNGYSYLDTLNHKAVKKFIEITHEAYKKECGKAFGKSIPGIFTDEPKFSGKLTSHLPMNIPWTGELPKTFKKRYGYDILDHLPEIYWNIAEKEITPARLHYHDCITWLFCDAFGRQIGEWCEENNLLFTGHVLAEDTLAAQTNVAGDCMRFYEYMQAPGIDLLTEHSRLYLTAKQLSSAANQFGRKWRLSETHGCTGWNFPFEGHKALSDWQTALGINLRCPHLSWYTMEGAAKRDYPASIFFQSPWWEEYNKVEDYCARITSIMTRGKEIQKILLLHPIESMWALVKKGWMDNPETKKLDESLIKVQDILLTSHLNFDYGSEEIIARMAEVSTKKGSPVFKIGEGEYNAVVVPKLTTIRASTLQILKEFSSKGGLVVFVGEPPSYVDGLPSDEAATFAAQSISVPCEKDRLVKSLEPICRVVSVQQENKEIPSILSLLKEDRHNLYLFLCNTSHSKEQILPATYDPSMVRDRKAAYPCAEIFVKGSGNGTPLELDPETGEIFEAEAKKEENGWKLFTSFPRIGSRLFILPKKISQQPYKKRDRLHETKRISLNKDHWEISFSEPNPLVLDKPAWRVNNGRWNTPEEILRIDNKIRPLLNLPPREGRMVQPWAQKISPHAKKVLVSLSYTIKIKNLPEGPLYLGIEKPEKFRITLNGNTILSNKECGWWTDPSLRLIPFSPSLLKTGDNTLELSCDYTADYTGLEIIYLLGEFGVQIEKKTPLLISKPNTLAIGDWTQQGLPFYSGSITYRWKGALPPYQGEVFLSLGDCAGATAIIFVNGKRAGIISWEPRRVNISQLLSKHTEEIHIELLGHRRNSHGPLHYAELWPRWVGPTEFASKDKLWSDAYKIVPCGMMESPEIIFMKKEEIPNKKRK
jgi:hypothetical protein